MTKKDKVQRIIKSVLCGLCLILTGCSAASMAQESTFESNYENGAEEEEVDIYTSAASVIIQSVDEENQTINMFFVDRNESRDLSYNGVTMVWDKYGSGMTVGQLAPGDIADITYNSELERVGSVTLSPDSWSSEGVVKYNLDAGNGNATIGKETYNIDSKVLVFSDGQPIDVSEIIYQDVLTFHGKGHTIMSIIVEKGHGYLELENDEAVLGGWIEVGQTAISQILPDMLITVPEGSYDIRITGTGIDESREVVINRNEETLLNLEDIKVQEAQTGLVSFDITPEKATVYVDEVKVNTAYSVKLPVGLHLVTAAASGYDSFSQYFEIEAGTNTVRMELKEASEVTVSGNEITSGKEDSKITIKSPEGVEVYQDNLYMGIAPVTYTKTAGEHTITLRKSGYITRSHTIVVADDDNDVTYSFPDLDPENRQSTVSGNNVTANDKKTVSGNSIDDTVSGNSVSGNSVADSTDR